MKLIVDARTLGSKPSGIGIYLFDFVKELATNKYFDILLVTDIAESEQIHILQKLNIPITCYGKKIFRSAGVFRYFKFIERILNTEQPDLFWEPNNLIPIKFKGYNGKIVLTIHDLFPITTPENFSWIYRLYFKYGVKNSLKHVDSILFDSEQTKADALRIFPSVEHKKCYTSYLIVQKPPYRLIEDGGYFLYIGNLERRKGTDILLDAYQLYLEQGGTRSLYLGGNVRETEINKKLHTLRFETDKLRYWGYLSEKRKFDLLSKCHCFLFPSRAEGFGIPPLEALGYGKPLITSQLPIFEEIIKLPIQTFPLTGDYETQVESLCRLMMLENLKPYDLKDSEQLLAQYNHILLTNKLATFFVELAEDSK